MLIEIVCKHVPNIKGLKSWFGRKKRPYFITNYLFMMVELIPCIKKNFSGKEDRDDLCINLEIHRQSLKLKLTKKNTQSIINYLKINSISEEC
jgi:hypothetical protein